MHQGDDASRDGSQGRITAGAPTTGEPSDPSGSDGFFRKKAGTVIRRLSGESAGSRLSSWDPAGVRYGAFPKNRHFYWGTNLKIHLFIHEKLSPFVGGLLRAAGGTDPRRRLRAAHRAALQRADERHRLHGGRMARHLPGGRPQRPLRRDDRLLPAVALSHHRLRTQIPASVGLDRLRGARSGPLLPALLQHPLPRIRQRRRARRPGNPRFLASELRPAALRSAAAAPLDPDLVFPPHDPLRGGDPLQRHQRIPLLERIRRPLQLHRRRLPRLQPTR